MNAAPDNRAGLVPEEVIFGRGAAMAAVRDKLARAAEANIPILIQGESGTGKEIIAQWIHRHSAWAMGRFVKVNCPAIPDTLVESELFGYERGAFTGAQTTRPGRVELAESGTLFLDEISELGVGLQSKLLQLLQDGSFCPIGGREDKKVEVRTICATNRQLRREVEMGRFRQDLFYRVNTIVIDLPPLRERMADLPLLIEYFLDGHSRRYNRPVPPLSAEALALLKNYDWPGNIRELENLTKRFVILGTEDALVSEFSPNSLIGNFKPEIPAAGPFSLRDLTRDALRTLEMKIILSVLQANRGNRKKAAQAMKISYRALLYKLKEFEQGVSLQNTAPGAFASYVGTGGPVQ